MNEQKELKLSVTLIDELFSEESSSIRFVTLKKLSFSKIIVSILSHSAKK